VKIPLSKTYLIVVEVIIIIISTACPKAYEVLAGTPGI
jgi:hypothetical protein